MNASDIAALLTEKFGSAIVSTRLDAIDPWIVVDPSAIAEVCEHLRDEPRLRFEMLNSVTGVDWLETDAKKLPKAGFEPHLEVVYHLSSITHRHRFVLKVLLPRWKGGVQGELPEVPSVSGVWRTADWHEREVYDLVGVWFTGHPDLRRILLSDDWEGHPLRKDYEFPLEYHGIRGR